MRTIFVLLFIYTSTEILGQNVSGRLFGKCDSDYSNYVCQQILLNDNNTFSFYSLLHLSGWTITNGSWNQNGDTITLNSAHRPYDITYKGNSLTDSIVICVLDSQIPIDHAIVKIDSSYYYTDTFGIVKYPRQQLDTMYIHYFPLTTRAIVVDKNKLNDTISVSLNLYNSDMPFFENEKWLLRNKKLYFRVGKELEYDSKRYFDLVKIKDLKYEKAK